MSQDVDQAALEIAELLPAIAVNLRVAALFDATVADLTANQLVTLLLVGNAENAQLRAGEIARRLTISAASATALVDRLVEAGMFARTRGEDRRVVWISLTEAGRDLIERLKTDTVSRISKILARSSPEMQDSLVGSLRQVAAFAHQISDGDTLP